MSGVSKEWLLIAVFFVTFFLFTLGEALWLKSGGRTTFIFAFAGALLTNILAITVGYGFSAVLLVAMLILAYGGSLESIGNVGLGIAAAIGILVPLVVLAIAKRLMVRILEISQMANPWIYSAVASICFVIATFTSVAMVAYFI